MKPQNLSSVAPSPRTGATSRSGPPDLAGTPFGLKPHKRWLSTSGAILRPRPFEVRRRTGDQGSQEPRRRLRSPETRLRPLTTRRSAENRRRAANGRPGHGESAPERSPTLRSMGNPPATLQNPPNGEESASKRVGDLLAIGHRRKTPCRSLLAIGHRPRTQCRNLLAIGHRPRTPCRSLPAIGHRPRTPCWSLLAVGHPTPHPAFPACGPAIPRGAASRPAPRKAASVL